VYIKNKRIANQFIDKNTLEEGRTENGNSYNERNKNSSEGS